MPVTRSRMPKFSRRFVRSVVAGIIVLATVSAAHAHFQLNLNVRILHVQHLSDGLRVYLRLPMPYLVADRLGAVGPDGRPAPAPYTSNRFESGKLVHYLDAEALLREPDGLGRLAAEGHRFVFAGTRLSGTVEHVRAYPMGAQPGFATLAEAERAIAGNPVWPGTAGTNYVGDTVVDVVVRYRSDIPVSRYLLSSTLNPGLKRQDQTANLILDYSPGKTQVFRARGLLVEPIEISRSLVSAVATSVWEGVRHILEGLDHVLFVLCLALGATRFKSLAWRATGFTIGHSVTLSLGFFGFVPSGTWFVPTVEIGIALSIIYAAAVAVFAQNEGPRAELRVLAVTTAIGLLHGLGFSFVLHEILRVDAPNIWQSLLAFNVGVEVGQLMIIGLAWPLFRMTATASQPAWRWGRRGIALACIATALFWTGERSLSLLSSLSS